MRNGSMVGESMNDLRNDFSAVVRDAEALIKATADVGSDRVQELRARTQTTLRQAREALSAEQWTGYVRTAARTTDEYAHEHPWSLIGAAAGTGLLIGMLARRH